MHSQSSDPPIALFAENTAAFVHELPAGLRGENLRARMLSVNTRLGPCAAAVPSTMPGAKVAKTAQAITRAVAVTNASCFVRWIAGGVMAHDHHADVIANLNGDRNYVRIQIFTPARVLDPKKMLGCVAEMSDIVAAAGADPTLGERTWVLITESPTADEVSGPCLYARGDRRCGQSAHEDALVASCSGRRRPCDRR